MIFFYMANNILNQKGTEEFLSTDNFVVCNLYTADFSSIIYPQWGPVYTDNPILIIHYSLGYHLTFFFKHFKIQIQN